MSKKFFSLIYGNKVLQAPKGKIIPAEEIAALQNAAEVLEAVQEDATKYKKEVVAEIEILKEQAQREGFEAGFNQWVEQIKFLEAEIEKVRAEVERIILPVALKAARKIVNKQIELSEDTIVEIVAANLKAVSQHKQITIYVNKKDLDIVEAQRPRLKQLFEKLESLSIRERADILPGGCVIETEVGIINAQLEDRWRVLETAFETMMTKGK